STHRRSPSKRGRRVRGRARLPRRAPAAARRSGRRPLEPPGRAPARRNRDRAPRRPRNGGSRPVRRWDPLGDVFARRPPGAIPPRSAEVRRLPVDRVRRRLRRLVRDVLAHERPARGRAPGGPRRRGVSARVLGCRPRSPGSSPPARLQQLPGSSPRDPEPRDLAPGRGLSGRAHPEPHRAPQRSGVPLRGRDADPLLARDGPVGMGMVVLEMARRRSRRRDGGGQTTLQHLADGIWDTQLTIANKGLAGDLYFAGPEVELIRALGEAGFTIGEGRALDSLMTVLFPILAAAIPAAVIGYLKRSLWIFGFAAAGLLAAVEIVHVGEWLSREDYPTLVEWYPRLFVIAVVSGFVINVNRVSLLNVRLGQWLPNPAVHLRAGLVFWHYFFLKELFSLTDENDWYVFVSDGGHFDNTGLYGLLERRCKTIIAVDCGADPTRKFEDIAN